MVRIESGTGNKIMRRFIPLLLCVCFLAPAALANPARDAILATLASQAKQADPAFSGFSVKRGSKLWNSTHTEGKVETPSCTTCHTKDATAEGMTRALKPIAPMAVSKTPDRFTDPDKVDKWFTRNCQSVLARTCTPTEKGDIITYLSSL
jgi:Domain of unknown function (DUF1924)